MRSDSMAMHSIKPGLLGLAVACALVSMQAHAIGMGTIEVKSKLNQPFTAEIPITLNTPDEANDLVVRLASPEAYARVGMDPRELSANLQFSVGRNARGETVVRVTTPQRMDDPYVTFLLEADWGRGKMVREYTALLDPPHMASVPRVAISAPTVASTPLPAPVAETPAPAITQPVAAPPPVASAPEPPPPPVAAQPSMPIAQAGPQTPEAAAPAPLPLAPVAAPELQPTPMAEAPPPSPSAAEAPPPSPVAEAPPPAPIPEAAPEATKAAADAVTVGKGQTLSIIAGQVRSPDVSVNRMMIALQRENPNAFINGNINLLKSGVVLRIPDSAQAAAVTPAEANALVHEQIESWRQGAQPTPVLQPEETADAKPAATARSETAGAASTDHGKATKSKSPPTPASNDTADSQATADASGARKPAKPRGAHLEIVPPTGNAVASSQSGASEGGSGSELRAQLAQTKEELTARNAEVNDLKSRVTDLEKMQKDSSQLLTMKDSQLAAMQQKLAELEKQQAAAAAASSATPDNAASPALAASGMVETASPAAAASASASPATQASTEVAAAPQPTPVAKPKSTPATPSEPVDLTPWYLQSFVLVGGGLLVLGGLLMLMLRRPRKPQAAPRSRFDAGALAASMAAARAEPQPVVHEVEYEDDAPVASAAPVADAPTAAAAINAPIAAVAEASAEHAPTPSDDDDWAIPGEATLSQEPVASSTDATAVRPAVRIGDVQPGISTKIELARAYIDIGDHDGARSMLEEVLIEGNAEQQEAAFALLDTLDT